MLKASLNKPTALPFPQYAPLHTVTCVQLGLITILGNRGCVAVASFLGVPSPIQVYEICRGLLPMQACTAELKLQLVSSGFERTCHNIIQVFAVEFRRSTHSSIMTSSVEESTKFSFKSAFFHENNI
jgi:hypothetical protein